MFFFFFFFFFGGGGGRVVVVFCCLFVFCFVISCIYMCSNSVLILIAIYVVYFKVI